MTGEVNNRNKGVKVTMGTVTERSDALMAFIYNTVVMRLSIPPAKSAGQKPLPKTTFLVKNNKGSKKGRAKSRSAQATMYSLHFSRLFLPNTSFNASNKAVKNE
jgi:hypothetical protein